MLKSLVSLVAFSLALHLSSAQAQQAETPMLDIPWIGKMQGVQITSDAGIPFLKWEEENITIETTDGIHYATVKGKFTEKTVHATMNGRPITVREDGTFEFYFGFPRETKSFEMSATTESGKTYRMKYLLRLKNPAAPDDEEVVIPGVWKYGFGAGLTHLAYQQSRVNPFNQWAVTVKGSIAYQPRASGWTLGLSSFYNILAFGSDSNRGYELQYLGLNARIGYALIGGPGAFRLNINGGLYFNTVISTIGFGNMYGPQLYPEFIYVFKNGNSILTYFKFSPAVTESGLNFTDNREIAAGTHYSFPISKRKRLSIGFDVSQLAIAVPPAWGMTNTYSLSAGLSF